MGCLLLVGCTAGPQAVNPTSVPRVVVVATPAQVHTTPAVPQPTVAPTSTAISFLPTVTTSTTAQTLAELGATADPIIRFYEGPCQAGAPHASYTSRFARLNTRCVHAEVRLTFPASAVGKTARLAWTTTLASGSRDTETLVSVPRAGQEIATLWIGQNQAGQMEPGGREVSLSDGTKTIAQGAFAVQ